MDNIDPRFSSIEILLLNPMFIAWDLKFHIGLIDTAIMVDKLLPEGIGREPVHALG